MSYRFSKSFRELLRARIAHCGNYWKRQNEFNCYVENLQTDILQFFDGDVTGQSVGLHGHYPSQIDPEAALAFITMEDVRFQIRTADLK